MKKETIGIIQLVLAAIMAGLIPVIVRYGENVGTYNLAFFRILGAIIILYLFFKISKKSTLKPFKYEKKKLICFGSIHGFIMIGYFIAIEYLSIGSAAFLFYSGSIWTVIFSIILLKEKLLRKTIFAILIAFVGVIFVIYPNSLLDERNLIGILGGLFGGIGMGFVYALSKTFKKYDKVSLTFWQNFIAIPFMFPLLFIEFPKLSFYDTIIILILTVVSVLGFVLIYKGFEKISGQVGGVVILLDIVFATTFAYLFFNEIPNNLAIIGGILIIIGSYLSAREQSKISRTPPEGL